MLAVKLYLKVLRSYNRDELDRDTKVVLGDHCVEKNEVVERAGCLGKMRE